MADHRSCHMQTRRAGAAIIVDIVDRNLCHAELIEDALAAGRVAIAIASNALINIVIVDLRVKKGLDAGFEAKFGIVNCT